MELLLDDSNVAPAQGRKRQKAPSSNTGALAPKQSKSDDSGPSPNSPSSTSDTRTSRSSKTSTDYNAPRTSDTTATTPLTGTLPSTPLSIASSTTSTETTQITNPTDSTTSIETSPSATTTSVPQTSITHTPAPKQSGKASTVSDSTSKSSPSSSSHVPAPASTISNPIPEDDMGYSSGALAGAIVGSIIGASIITLLIAILFFRKRSKAQETTRRHRSHHSSPRRRRTSDLGAAFVEKKTSTYASDELQWQAYLPQAADDNTVRQTVKTLFDRVELHVDNYYRRSEINVDEATAQSLSQLSVGRPPLAVERLMSDPRMAPAAIKRCITDTLIVGMRPGRYPEGALLPDHLANAPLQMQTSSSGSHGEEFAPQRAYSMWKRLTAYLHVATDDNKTAFDQKIGTAISGLTRQLAQAFAPWQDLGTDAAKENERELFHLASSVGIMVASQPCMYRFAWGHDLDHPDATSRRHLVVFPSFWKMTDEEGRTLERPQRLLSATVVDA